MLLPHLGSLLFEAVTDRGAGVVVDARLRDDEAACPGCGQPSRRVHSRYRRQLVDAPITGRPVQLRLRVRRFFCDNVACAARTFAEQPAALTAPRARRTSLLRRMLASIAVALAGRAGARLADRLGMPTSRDSLHVVISRSGSRSTGHPLAMSTTRTPRPPWRRCGSCGS